MGRVSRWQNAMETQRELVYQQQGERCDDMFRAPFRAAGTAPLGPEQTTNLPVVFIGLGEPDFRRNLPMRTQKELHF